MPMLPLRDCQKIDILEGFECLLGHLYQDLLNVVLQRERKR